MTRAAIPPMNVFEDDGVEKAKVLVNGFEHDSIDGLEPVTHENSSADNEIDPLDAYMQEVNQEVNALNEQDRRRMQQQQQSKDTAAFNDIDTVENESTVESPTETAGKFATVEELIAFVQKKSTASKKDLVPVDHSTIEYIPFRKNFYVESSEIARMSVEEIREYRKGQDNIQVRGIKCPRPIKSWYQTGLSLKILEVLIGDLKYERPTPIQAQALPVIMSGRDLIGIAKTGSGKTMAFLLPMFRHVLDQPALEPGEGPMALIMTPTRELAMQTYSECMRFARILGLRVVCAYGGAPIKDQIADLKRGAEIVICTPGRMIDLLIANSGRITNLKRITYLVLDEADRMFDMGFGPQVVKIINNIRPDKQVVLFSATFPKQMDLLARKVLTRPIEIVVGGISTVCDDVEQIVEVVAEESKFLRLLAVLGEWYETLTERILIFVDRQDSADHLLKDLLKRGYPCMSLHGGKDQADRDSTIADFKAGNIPILVATSVAARGLDVKDLGLVINYECPNHMEDYVHRVGRTGRAGNKGTAITFITPEQERFAPDIVRALKTSSVDVPVELATMAERFLVKVRAGEAQSVGFGFGGKGLERIDEERMALRKNQKRAFGDEEDEEEEPEKPAESEPKTPPTAPANPQTGPAAEDEPAKKKVVPDAKKAAPPVSALKAVQQAAAAISSKLASKYGPQVDALAAINAKYKGLTAVPAAAAGSSPAMPSSLPASGVVYPMYETRPSADEPSQPALHVRGYYCEIDINDYPQAARWRVTSKETVTSMMDLSETSIIVRGLYFPAGKQPGIGERKLHLRIEGAAEVSVERARSEIQRVLIEATMEAAERGGIDYSRYNI